MSNKLNMSPPKPEKHPKSGPRSYIKGDKESFDYGYMGIDWGNKKKPVKDPNIPVCPVCDGESTEGSCPGCV
jgi:hypothetical protein